MDALTVPANLADGLALLRGGLGDLLGHAADGGDGGDDFAQRLVGALRQAGGAFGVGDLAAHGFDRLGGGLLQIANQLLDFRGGAAGALRQ